ncbi:MAG: alanine-zipper protein [Bacilli bacterium]
MTGQITIHELHPSLAEKINEPSITLVDSVESMDMDKAATANAVRVAHEKGKEALLKTNDVQASLNELSSQKARPNGLATLDETGKVLRAQFPNLDYVSTDNKLATGTLNTVEKTNIVTAVNEVNTKATNAQDTANTAATKADNAQSTANAAQAKAEQAFTSASEGKNKIAEALTGKGIQASSDNTFQELANKISSIPSGKKFASGRVAKSPGMTSFPKIISGSVVQGQEPFIQVSGLGFRPHTIIATHSVRSELSVEYSAFIWSKVAISRPTNRDNSFDISIFSSTGISVNDGGFMLPVQTTNLADGDWDWRAYGE